jgi:hypothetical protein
MKILFLLLFSSSIVHAQNAVAIAAAAGAGSSKYAIDYQKHTGYIILNSGEKVSGTFEYATWEFPTFNLKLYNDYGDLIKRYKISKIDKAVFYGADSSLTNADSTTFVRLNNRAYFFRQLTNGPVKIYDDLFNINERPGLIKSGLLIYYQDKVYKTDSKEQLKKRLEALVPSLVISKDAGTARIIKELNSML